MNALSKIFLTLIALNCFAGASFSTAASVSLRHDELGWSLVTPRATVLVGKLEIIMFEEAVHEDDEFAHARRHGDERLLAGGQQAQIKFFQDAIMTDGA